MTEQDKIVADYLQSIGADYSARLLGETTRDDWKCDEWRVAFQRKGKPMIATHYYTGTGHRKSARPMPADIARLGARILARVEWEKANVEPVKPTAARVLYSLILEAQGAEEPFDDWCADYGFDQDSRKALATCDACCAIHRQVNAFFTNDEREQLRTMLEDY